MAEVPVSSGPGVQGGESGVAPAGAPNIDVQLLAEKVYNLLLADVRLGRARGSSPVAPRRDKEG